MTASEEINRLIEQASKNLSPSDRIRWKWGFVDGLKEALKIIEKHSGKDGK